MRVIDLIVGGYCGLVFIITTICIATGKPLPWVVTYKPLDVWFLSYIGVRVLWRRNG